MAAEKALAWTAQLVSYLSILSAIDFVKEHFGVEMEKPEIVCTHSAQNNQFIGKRCPFSKAGRETQYIRQPTR